MVILDGFGVHDTDTLRQRLTTQADLARRVEKLENERTPARPILCNGYLVCGACERSLRLERRFCPHCGKKVMRLK